LARGLDKLGRGRHANGSLPRGDAPTTGIAREAARRHGAVGGTVAALGRAAACGLLLATLTKERERLTAQILGNGPLGAVVIDADGTAAVRVYVKNPGTIVPALPGAHVPLGRAIGAEGVVRVARDLGLKEIVNGQTPLVEGEIDTDLERYLHASEQIMSALGAETLLGDDLDAVASGGLLLQALPGSDALPLLDELRARLRDGALTRALAALPATAGAEALARAVLGEEAHDLEILDVRPATFSCRCSKERAATTLALLGAADLSALAAEQDETSVTCEFCRERHVFSRADLERIRDDLTGRRPS
jgi:molecular chaperone Hsp33